MARLEDLTKGALVRGVLAERAVRVVDVDWHGSSAITLTYTDDSTGRPNQELLYRDDEVRLSVEQAGRAWSMDADGRLFRLVSEARRISLAWLFDPFLAVQTSNLDPLPHQIDAVYNQMLPRQPLRYLLADDPGAGKTIMAGLFCKELMIRGDVERCLVIAPGSLVDQWQDELWSKFGLNFEILTKDMIESARSGNPFAERPLLIARLDHLSRNEDLQAKLEATDWDLVIADEAHKMSAHYVGGEVKETKRYKLGRLAGSVARHLLLMTATPHAGIEEDFHLFLALLDADRFEGKPRKAVHAVDTSDLMRRLVKERLLKFDGTPLFPERRSYTAIYPLSDAEALLYKRVTEYVTEEMNRADRLKAEGEGRRGTVVGFALTGLQRRLASSPEAIYQSLVRRRRRLENRVAEERLRKRGAEIAEEVRTPKVVDDYRSIDDDFDLDDLAEEEREELEEELVDQASAARTIAELEYEIATLADLAELAGEVRASGTDRKWEELSRLLQDTPEMFDAQGNRRKLIVFSEHRDTLNYLVDKLRLLLGRDEAVVTIHGGLPREERRKVQEAFVQDKDVLVLVATDAAGEGINLQRAHLMVNYDLPWNPNRIEQRFGRVHRIGQTEVCHLWNLMAEDTREGQVFQRLFAKLDEQRKALGDQVFDVLGESFRGTSLRDLLIEAVRYGEQPLVRARLSAVVDATVGDALQEVIHERALVTDVMTGADVERIRRIYLAPDEEHERIARSAVPPDDMPDTDLPKQALGFRVQGYGMTKHRHLFTDRQLVALCTFSDLVGEARLRIVADGGNGDYADAVVTYLALLFDRVIDRHSSITTWDASPSKLQVRGVFARQAIPMSWDFAEANLFGRSSGAIGPSTAWVARVVDRLGGRDANTRQLDATAVSPEQPVLYATDPPYYDNIGYADLSDFFYVWLRRSLKAVHPDLFSTLLVPKVQELVADPFRHDGDRRVADKHFESGIGVAFDHMRQSQAPGFPLTVIYAFKQAEEASGLGSLSSTGWETMLEGLIRAGLSIHGTWPLRSELSNRPRGQGSNALASSIALVCRARPDDAPLATRKELLGALKAELPDALRKLQSGNIAPVDLAQSAIGPGMGVFSRYSRVVEADGTAMTVRTALGLINQMLDETLSEQEGDFDGDTRWALAWFEETSMNPGPYGKAETLSKAKNTSIAGLVHAGFLESKAGKVRLLARSELAGTWDPAADTRLTVWEVTQHLILALETGGEPKAAELLRRVGGLGETAKELAYRLYVICERKKWASEALAYNALVVAWPEITRLAAGAPAAVSIQPELS